MGCRYLVRLFLGVLQNLSFHLRLNQRGLSLVVGFFLWARFKISPLASGKSNGSLSLLGRWFVALWVTYPWNSMQHLPSSGTGKRSRLAFKSLNKELLCQPVLTRGSKWSFIGGSTVVLQREVPRSISRRKGSSISACWIATSQIAGGAFTWGTIAVLPFYTLMVVAPNAQLTKRTMESYIPYAVLGVVYAYLLYLSWTPDTLRAMFASKYLLPELSGITKLFSSEVTMASAWIHLLAVDLFAARQVFHDGLKNKIETRHSVSLCLLFCPIGIATHAFTKFLTKTADRSH